ncbi:thioredoxin domain-containing protein [Parapedobacter sp. ISTM3]|uniref:thioredoxin domain-containing protein n=1 Tax=Parapedobacter sp. ISTM3 TaxID=2800130 RepID=UPI0019079C27|nr:thioredoxin domain-containing protein [Parapedobacter sp. ISTM3]MBK1438652.1 thioredoxin domain-containing protein [Parapedobacter sp. ISTM3]
MPNKLHNETSPYLRQHQHNPVAWYPWGAEALNKAKAENKLLIVSIGYSACHWCHVMERESFENEDIAAVMNAHFVSVKVDREERPDIDQIYMIAVQLMTNQGGWPLNCVCLPDGRPIYGGTYFRPDDWRNVLLQLNEMWRERPEVAYDYADRLTAGVRQSEQLPINRIPEAYSTDDLQAVVTPWKRLFDKQEGGYKRVPKFPLPNNWLFLLRYAVLAQDSDVLEHVHFTLQKIASGGIYDHVGGGFARYAVDGQWHIPHFEKMLYDNAQLVSLYAEAWQQRPIEQYKRVVAETLEWVLREMTSPQGGFYCALDADSEGVEGKFYTFHQSEIAQILGADAELFIRYFGVTEEGNWEEEQTNVLKIDVEADKMAHEAGFSTEEWEKYLAQSKQRLLDYRSIRVRPGLDDKLLASWNGLMLKGFVDAYRVFDVPAYLKAALDNAQFIRHYLYAKDGGLLHQPEANGKIIMGFLDDYACCIEAFVSLYEATFDETWLYEAKRLMEHVLSHFYDQEAAAFYFTSATAEELIARKQEIMDNVIPSSTSTIVRQLYRLGLIFDKQQYIAIGSQVLANVVPHMEAYGSAYSNWAIQLLEQVYGCYEIVFTGAGHSEMRKELDNYYIPNKIVLGGTKETLPLLAGRVGHATKAYVCRNKTCSLPVEHVEELLELITQ